MPRTIGTRGRSLRAAAALFAIAILAVAGCGGDDAVSLDDVTSSLEDAGYMVSDTGAGSKFTKVKPTGSLLVQGNDLPASGFVVVEAYSSSEDAETVLGQYEKIKTPAVAADTLVYSAAPPADQADVDAVVEAAGS